MPRTDRLFDLIQILRDGRLHRAQDLAERLDISVRTIWRDMATLAASGLPVEGERGVGYILRAPITLPPMIMTAGEIAALKLGIRLVVDGADPGLERSARSLAAKIASVVPQSADVNNADELFVFKGHPEKRPQALLPQLRAAIRQQERVAITYLDTAGRETHRDIRPLQLESWGKVWSLVAFCEGQMDFRLFRLDRIVAFQPTGEVFGDDPGCTLEDYRAKISLSD